MSWKVGDVMSRPALTVSPAEPIKRCLDLMRLHQVSALLVVGPGNALLGVLSEADLMRCFEGRPTPPAAINLMERDVATIRSDASVAAAARLMSERGVNILPVVDAAGGVVGVCSRADVLRVFLRSDESIRKEVVNGLLNELPLLGRGRVQVEVSGGVVHLRGDVESGALTGLLLRLVAAVPGVVGVENHPHRPVASHA